MKQSGYGCSRAVQVSDHSNADAVADHRQLAGYNTCRLQEVYKQNYTVVRQVAASLLALRCTSASSQHQERASRMLLQAAGTILWC